METWTLAEILPASQEQAAAALALVVCNHSSHPNREQSAHSTKPETIWMGNSSPELLRGPGGYALSQESCANNGTQVGPCSSGLGNDFPYVLPSPFWEAEVLHPGLAQP